MSEEFITLAEAATRLKVSKSTVSRIINRNKDKIPTKSDTIDTRLMLVEYTALETVFSSSVRYKNR
jgi:predicted DNA-binding protein (UPF0251 family)